MWKSREGTRFSMPVQAAMFGLPYPGTLEAIFEECFKAGANLASRTSVVSFSGWLIGSLFLPPHSSQNTA
jgi:hypothetical protein